MATEIEIPKNTFQANEDTHFNIDFYVDGVANITIMLNGVVVAPSSYTIEDDIDSNGTRIVFYIPITGTLVITRDTPLERITEYNNTLNNITASNLNYDFDRIYRIMQEIGVDYSSIQDKLDIEKLERISGDGDLYTYINSLVFGGNVEPQNLKTKQPYPEAVERLQIDKNNENITIKDFGAIGDGVTNDTLAFNNLPYDLVGSRIDLKGLTYKVDNIPTNARYYNGDFILPTRVVSLRRNPLDNPIDGDAVVALGDGLQHYWCFDAVTLPNKQIMALVKPAHTHGRSTGSPVFALYSEDGGVTFNKGTTIYSYAGYDITDLKIIQMPDRVGVVVTLIPFDTSLPSRVDYWYTNNVNIGTWTILENVAPYTFVYGPAQALISGTPGSSYVVYGYSGNSLYALITHDKGNTWTRQTMSDLPGVEAYIVRVNNENKWIAFVRGETNLRISTSTDQLNWSPLVDTGILLGNHPVQAYVDRGRLFVYIFSRDFTPSTVEFENRCMLIEDDPRYVFDNKVFKTKAARTAIKGANRSLGYMTILKDGFAEDEFIYFVNASETDNNTSQPSISHVYVGHTARRMLLPKPSEIGKNLLDNPTFDYWDRGDSFTVSGTSSISIANRWRMSPSESTVTVTKVPLTMNQSKLLPFRGQYGCKITATANDFISIQQRHFNRDLFFKVQENVIMFQIWGMGTAPNTLRFQITRDPDNGDPILSASELIAITTQPEDGIWRGTCRVTVVPILSTLASPKTVGPNPNVYFNLSSFISTGWDFTILGMKAEIGQEITTFEPTDAILDKIRSSSHMQVLTYTSDTAIANGYVLNDTRGEYLYVYPDMVKTPVIQFSNTTNTLTMYPQNQNITSLTASAVRESSCIFLADKSASTPVFFPSMLRIRPGATFKIFLECV